jgi:hypothetical protein
MAIVYFPSAPIAMDCIGTKVLEMMPFTSPKKQKKNGEGAIETETICISKRGSER